MNLTGAHPPLPDRSEEIVSLKRGLRSLGYKARNLFYRRGRLPGEGIVLQQMFFMSMQDKAFSSVSNGRWESSLSASAEAKPSEKQKKQGSSFSLPSTGNASLVESSIYFKRWAPEGVQGASGKPPGRLRRGETLCEAEKAR